MALDPLATAADLSARAIDVPELLAATFLVAASAAVRDAAGVPISRATSTVTVPAPSGQWLDLQGLAPVVSVSSVLIDDEAVAADEYKLVGSGLWRQCGWLDDPCEPGNVTLTLVHGYAEVPADIVDLVCALVASAGGAAEGGGYEALSGLQSVKIDDYSETYETGGNGVTGRLELPRPTREWLRQRFGGGVYVTGSR